ncbi:TPA: hypothetical protein ACXG29_004935, partial [Enterobacter hormaechei]
LCKGSQVFGKAGILALKDDIFSRPVDISRDSYESIVSDQAVYFAGRLFLSAVRITGRILLCRCRQAALSGNERTRKNTG